IHDYAYRAVVMTQVCPGLVPLIERGIVEGPMIDDLLELYLAPILEAGADVVVLGCTHYPLVRPTIERICGPEITLVDPSAAIARQVSRIMAIKELASESTTGGASYYTTGDPEDFARVLSSLTGAEMGTALHVDIRAPVA